MELLAILVALIITPIGVQIGFWINDNISWYNIKRFFLRKGRRYL